MTRTILGFTQELLRSLGNTNSFLHSRIGVPPFSFQRKDFPGPWAGPKFRQIRPTPLVEISVSQDKIACFCFSWGTWKLMRNIWIYISFKWRFNPIIENSYCNRSNLSVIGKKIQKYDMKFELFDISLHVFYEKQMQVILS